MDNKIRGVFHFVRDWLFFSEGFRFFSESIAFAVRDVVPSVTKTQNYLMSSCKRLHAFRLGGYGAYLSGFFFFILYFFFIIDVLLGRFFF